MIELRDVVKENYNDCLALDVADEQRGFVATNLYSMAQAYIYRDVVKLFAIYGDDTLVGFVMLDVDKARDEFWIWRFMIDKRFQRKGYGKEALRQILEYFASTGAATVKLSFEPGNTVAEKLYESCGFRRNGDLHDGEIVMQADMPQSV